MISSGNLRCEKGALASRIPFDATVPGTPAMGVTIPGPFCFKPSGDSRELTLEWESDLLTANSAGLGGEYLCEGCSAPP